MPEKLIGILDPEGKNKNPLTGKKYRDKYEVKGNSKELGTNDYQFLAKDPRNDYGGWSRLPMYEQAREIIKLIRENDVCIIESGTGTGKTVILPKLALHVVDYKKNVVMTVPKTSLAVSSGGYAAKCLDVELGEEVGFKHKGSQIEKEIDDEIVIFPSSSDKTKFLFATDGTILTMVKNDPKLEKYDIVIIDEAHERSTNIDLLLFYLRETVLLRKGSSKELKLIVTSATMPKGRIFQKYFLEVGLDVGEKFIIGKPLKEIEEHCSKKNIKLDKMSEECVELIFRDIINKKLEGDIMIFTTTGPKAEKLCDLIRKRDKNICCIVATANTVAVTEVPDPENPDIKYSLEDIASGEGSNKDLFQRLYPKNKYKRKVIISTNVWESSITLNQLVYVVDNGYLFESSYDGKYMIDNLMSSKISKGSAAQRKGRVGRVQPGVAYKMYTEKDFKSRPPDPIPPMQKENIIEQVFDFANEPDVENIADLKELKIDQLLSPPTQDNFRANIRVLAALNLIKRGVRSNPPPYNYDIINIDRDTHGGVSFFGKKIYFIMKALKLKINLAVAYYYGLIYDCRGEILILNIFMESKLNTIEDFFFDTKEPKVKERMKDFYREEGDFFTAIHIVKRYFGLKLDIASKRKWCKKNYLKFHVLDNFAKSFFDRKRGIISAQYNFLRSEKYEELIKKDLYLEPRKQFANLTERLQYCLLKAYYYNLAESVGDKKYKNRFTKYTDFDVKKKKPINYLTKTTIDKRSAVMVMNSAKKYIFYESLMRGDSGTNYIMCNNISEKILNHLSDSEKTIIGL